MSETTSIVEESQKSKTIGGIFKRFTLKRGIVALVIIAVGIIGAWFFFFKDTEKNNVVQAKQETWQIKRDDVRVAIEADGKVVADDMVALSYPITGVTIENVFIKQGDNVKKGDALASMNTATYQFDLRSAQTSYESALNNLQLKQIAPEQEQIDSALTAIEQAQISLDQQKISYEQTKMSAEQNVNNAVRSVETAKTNLLLNKDAETSQIVDNAYTTLFNTLQSMQITLNNLLNKSDDVLGVDDSAVAQQYKGYIGALDSTAIFTAEISYKQAKIAKLEFDALMDSLTSSSDRTNLDSAIDKADAVLEAMRINYLDLQRVLDYSITSSSFTQSALDGLKSTVSSNLSSITSNKSNLFNSRQSITNAKNSLSNLELNYEKVVEDLDVAKVKAEQDLANAEASLKNREISLKQAQLSYDTLMEPPRDIDLVSARISVENAKIGLDRVLYNIDQATLRSPIDGEVVELNGKAGDLVAKDNSQAFVNILNKDTLFIEVNIEEADINKISVGQKAYITFDALEDVELQGEVSFVSVISTQSQNGITSYLVRVLLDQEGTEGIREGMTAFVEFSVAESNDVLVAPVTAVKNVSGKPSVQLESGEWVPVVTGFTDGKMVEIINGVKVGDTIIYTL
ncbi:efflux RND transporter periplasmic adaptor subunit [Patescibacteria group bacterium]|nr:efflux RND transporter periplasmic adaptor subunit [Patescibacteria group bacterium]